MNAPTFALENIQTNEQWSLDQFINHKLMITFWASWCPDSQKDLKQKQALYESTNSDEVKMITINVTGRERGGDINKFLEENHITFPVLADDGTKTYDAYRCMGVPTTVLLNEHHEIIATYHDKSTFMDIMKGLSTLLR
ncbi:TlpA disulfide reductase family protein [Halalkalibacter urbisdiaboli]|uniref:TlpA disulfide reductase family protein n=1 Tax=Halalkalibacter urbisdiaboli TaxID=1960589 RepID=UPI0013FD81DD|nr:TlpA disulfide reductase family protein [Halalkalibacter urbisdiaboli]